MVYPIGPKIAYIGDDVGIQFDYLIAGQCQTFVVMRQALQDHFELRIVELSGQQCESALREAFLRGWEKIRNVAARSRTEPNGGRIVLKSVDFHPR